MNDRAGCGRRRIFCRTYINDFSIFKDDPTRIEPVMLSIERENQTTVQMDTGHVTLQLTVMRQAWLAPGGSGQLRGLLS
jgi:hypothetical protein